MRLTQFVGFALTTLAIACDRPGDAHKLGAVNGTGALFNNAQITYVGTFNGDASMPMSLVTADASFGQAAHFNDAGRLVPTTGSSKVILTITSYATLVNACNAPVTLAYQMVGGGGGAGGGRRLAGQGNAGGYGGAGGGGGGSSALVIGATVLAANGGAAGNATGFTDAGAVNVGANGVPATASVTLAVGATMTVYVGGGGGSGGWNWGGGGGVGLFGGGGGGGDWFSGALTPAGGGTGTAGGAAGVSGTAGNDPGTAGAQFVGGSGYLGSANRGGIGGVAGNGGIGGSQVGSLGGGGGGGGGGYGAGGGAANDNGSGTPSLPGASNGASAASLVSDAGATSTGGAGGTVNAAAASLPVSAGLGGTIGGQGGNGGLVILSYTPPTGVPCLLPATDPSDTVTSGGDASSATILHSLPIATGTDLITGVVELTGSKPDAGSPVYTATERFNCAAQKSDAGVKTTRACAADLALAYSDGGASDANSLITITPTVLATGVLSTVVRAPRNAIWTEKQTLHIVSQP